jgi:hypothetical protein
MKKSNPINRVRAFALFVTAVGLASVTLPLVATVAQDDAKAGRKTIKDQAEYTAYMAALNEPDAAKRAVLMEAFVGEYPESIVKLDALEQAMAAYQKSENPAKVEATAKRILQLKPNHVQALAIVVALDRNKTDPAAVAESCVYAKTGLQELPGWTKPEAVTATEFEQLRAYMSGIFNGASGSCAFHSNDYSTAREALAKAVLTDPTNLEDFYELTVADLETNPVDLSGFWYCVKTINLAQRVKPDAVKDMSVYCKSRYRKYHGGEDGWDAFVASATQQNSPPQADDLAKAIPRGPTPCELAVKAVHDNKMEDLPFADYEFILQHRDCSPANKEAADQVWAYVQGLQKNGEAKIKLPSVKVVAANKDTLDAAVTEENQSSDKADLHVVFVNPVLKPPAKGAMTDITGLIKDYTPEPFMFTMEQGELPRAMPAVKKPSGKGKAVSGSASKKKLT